MQAEQIKSMIIDKYPNAIVEVKGDDGRHFSAVVVADEFMGKTKVKQQQLVYECLGEHIANGDIHALSLKTYTPDDWKKENK